jgi:hypothetical protein
MCILLFLFCLRLQDGRVPDILILSNKASIIQRKISILDIRPRHAEFLTHKTTCANVMSKRTTCENICQKRPPLGGGTFGQATRGTCRLGRRRHGHAATANAGKCAGS